MSASISFKRGRGAGSGGAGDAPGVPARRGAPRGAASRAALTVFVMKGELQRVLQQGPEHAVGRRDKGGVQGKRSGHFLHRDALNFFFLKLKKKKQTKKLQPPPKMLLSFFLRPLPKVLAFKAVETREEKKKLLMPF